VNAALSWFFDGVSGFHVLGLLLISAQLRGIKTEVGALATRVLRLELLPTNRAELRAVESETVH
jgi:hypothetical protein